MHTKEMLGFAFVFLVSVVSFIISYFQFKEKGFLFNNVYLYASKEERKTMDKKPHYRQSAIVFLLLGIIFLLLAIEIVLVSKWLNIVMILLLVSAMIYGIVSSIHMQRKSK